MKLTQEQKRIKIAEACGWTCIAREPRLHSASQLCGKPPVGNSRSIPDYFNDLNACHEMEKTLFKTGDMWSAYFENLDVISEDSDCDSRSSSSKIRFEAAGQTLKLWEAGE